VLDAAPLLDETELAVEPDRGCILHEDAEAQLVQAALTRPFDRSRQERWTLDGTLIAAARTEVVGLLNVEVSPARVRRDRYGRRARVARSRCGFGSLSPKKPWASSGSHLTVRLAQ